MMVLRPPPKAMKPEDRERYSRQVLFTGIGESGQENLLAADAVLVGCGAIGTVVAGLMIRAGIGRLRIIDRDYVEHSNLQRQALFDEIDAREALPKAIAAQRHLSAINSAVPVEGVVADLTPANAEQLLGGFTLVLDGTDNFETRLLINDAAVSLRVPWIYAAALGSYGVTMTIRPEETACLACLLEADGAAVGNEATCDTVGILGGAASVAASLASAEALKILAGRPEMLHQRLVSCDVWTGKFQSIRVARNPDCRTCGHREFRYLAGKAQPHITLCGRDSVQIHATGRRLDLGDLGQRLLSASIGEVRNNDFLLRFRVPPYEMTVFADGRTIVKGTKDPAIARSLYARYLGT